MARIYPELVGVPEYCDAIDEDCNHSPFVPIAKLKDPVRIFEATDTDIEDLADDGFFVVDPLGRIVFGGARSCCAYVIAPHVAQREKGGRSPKKFDREVRGAQCGFGGPRAMRLTEEQAAGAVALAWTAWNHA
jgi:hypothetical protein